MKVKIEVWARIEGEVEANTPHDAYHKFDTHVKAKLVTRTEEKGQESFYITAPLDFIRCYAVSSLENLDPGDISTTPCKTCYPQKYKRAKQEVADQRKEFMEKEEAKLKKNRLKD